MKAFAPFRFVSDLKIRTKLLFWYAAPFILSFSVISFTVYNRTQKAIIQNVESELLNSTRNICNMVKISADLSIKNYLRAISERNKEIATYLYRLSQIKKISEVEAKRRALNIFSSQTIGTSGYIYCMNSTGKVIKHPKKSFVGMNLSGYTFIQTQKREKEGFLEYNWKNPKETTLRPKALYMTYFEPWDWIISATSYRSELSALSSIQDFKEPVLSLKFSNSGSVLILDNQDKLLLKPKRKGGKRDTVTVADNNLLFQQMRDKRRGKIISFLPGQGDIKPRKTLIIFDHIPDTDWIIAATSYFDEFYAPLKPLWQVFMISAILTVILLIGITLKISSSITRPLRDLMSQLSNRTFGNTPPLRPENDKGNEIDALSSSFNQFMDRLDDYSDSMKTEVINRKKMKIKMLETRFYLKNIINVIPSVIIGVDLNENITQYNKAAHQLFKISKYRAKRKPLSKVLPQLKSVPSMIKRTIEKKVVTKTQKTQIILNEQPCVLDISVYPLIFKSIEGALIRIDDITEKVQREKATAKKEKQMLKEGPLTAMAYEMSLPLNEIQLSIQNIERCLSLTLIKNIRMAKAYDLDLEKIQAFLKDQKVLYFMSRIHDACDIALKTVENMPGSSPKARK